MDYITARAIVTEIPHKKASIQLAFLFDYLMNVIVQDSKDIYRFHHNQDRHLQG